MHDLEGTRKSWNNATRNHNAHKGDQARFFREGGDVLFPEELDFLGALEGRSLVHLQCNAGQDSLGLARRGAKITGVDLSDEAIAFARELSSASGITATFEQGDVVAWMQKATQRFDLGFSSYGAAGWLPDLSAWARGIHRVLAPGGRFVYVEFHPLVWSWGTDMRPTKDDYFARGPFHEPVSDYVAASGSALGAVESGATEKNEVPAMSYQYTFAEVLDALAQSGLVLERVREYPYANGCKLHESHVAATGRRWVWPEGIAATPLMFALSVKKLS